ncbi:MAG: glycosyltransferase family 2 protein [Geminicoccaceae bacterium]
MSACHIPRCSIVVRCYNEERQIGRLLHGITAQTLEDIEIIVVDSGSTDRTIEIARQFPVRLLHIEPERFSFGRSLNLGCEAARSELVIAVSAHCHPLYTDWLATLLAPLEDPRVALSYGRQHGASTTRFSEHRVFASWFPSESDTNQPHPFCNNANAAIRRSIWRRFRYDETLTGLEDVAFAKALMAEGHRVAYAADAAIVHVHDETWRQVFNRYQREAIALRRIFPEERLGAWDFIRLFAGNVAADARAARRQGCLARNVRDIVIFRLMQFAGTYRGMSRTGGVTSQLRHRFYYPNHTSEHAPAAAREGSVVDYGEEPGLSR